MAAAPARSRWLVAEGEAGEILGLQWIEPHAGLPDEAANIATFVLPGRQQLGIGSALFAATERAARDVGYVWINATIRADNEGGLVYYQSRGFRVWTRETGVEDRAGAGRRPHLQAVRPRLERYRKKQVAPDHISRIAFFGFVQKPADGTDVELVAERRDLKADLRHLGPGLTGDEAAIDR